MMDNWRNERARRKAVRALDRASDPKSRWYAFVILLIFAVLIVSLGIREFSAVPALRYDEASPVAQTLAAGGTVADPSAPEALEAVAAAQTVRGGGWLTGGGCLLIAAGIGLFILLFIVKRQPVWAITAVPLTVCGIGALCQGIAAGKSAALCALLPGFENLNRVQDLFSVSADAQVLVIRADLYAARWGILCLGLVLTAVGVIGLVKDRIRFRATVDRRTVKSLGHSLGVAGLVILLYVGIAVTFMGFFYTIGTATNAAGMGDALNAYGRSALSDVEKTITDADTAVVKAEARLTEAQQTLADAEAKAAAATGDAKKKADKEVKKAQKEIDKQQRKIEEAKAAREEAVQNFELAEASVKTYPPYGISDLFRFIDTLLPYQEQYGTQLDRMYAAVASEKAAEWNLNEDEMTVLAKKVGGYGISASDEKIMRVRWFILAAGAVMLAVVILVGRRRHVLGLVFRHWFLSLAALISVFPFFWIVVSATNTSLDVTLGKLWFGNNLLVNVVNAAFTGSLSRSFVNSLRNALVVTFGSLIISSAAGYGFVVYKDKAKDAVLKFLMLSMMIPTAATLVPLFKLFGANRLNILNTTWAVVLPGLATAFLIFMFRQGAQSFPKDLIEAARIDGMGEFGIFAKIFFPVMRPTYAAAATVTFMNAWNAYLWPLVALNVDEAQTMPIYIANILEGYVMDYGAIMFAVTVSTLPTVIIFFFLQKSFVEGIIGSVKQ